MKWATIPSQNGSDLLMRSCIPGRAICSNGILTYAFGSQFRILLYHTVHRLALIDEFSIFAIVFS